MRRKRLIGGLTLALLLALVAGGCDSIANLNISEVSWDGLKVISAVPMKKSGDGFEPLCRSDGTTADGLLLRVLLKGTEKKGEEGAKEKDKSIRPGDRIDLREVVEEKVTPARFSMGISCIDQQPPSVLGCTSEECGAKLCDDIKDICVPSGANACASGVKSDSLNISKVRFKEFTPSRADAVAVAILLDNSGSMNGLVNFYPPYNEASKEAALNTFPAGSSFGDNASDPNQARIAATRGLIENLNSIDRFILFSFNENSIEVVCELPGDPDADFDTKLENCFGNRQDLVTKTMAFSDLHAQAKGRSPLWTAVDKAWEYMNNHPVTQAYDYKHIVVITDGPDTCSASSDQNLCETPCLQYSTGYDSVRAKVEAMSYEDRIPIHFVQFEAKGYQDRDPRQQEMACLTGGHYVFLNSLDFPTEFSNFLQTMVTTVRYTFGGYWEFAIEMGAFGQDTTLERGWSYGIEGQGKVIPNKDDPLLVTQENIFEFLIEGNIDKRLSVRKDCRPGIDSCPGDEVVSPCATRTWWCDEQSRSCKSALKWQENGTGAAECGSVPAVLKVLVSHVGSTQSATTETIQLGTIASQCCNGECMPPNPPEIPEALRNSTEGGKLCFDYDTVTGWTLADPANPSAGWAYWATLYLGQAGCDTTLADITDAAVYDPGALVYECLEQTNCFPPVGE